MPLQIEPSGASCGAIVRGVELGGPLDNETIDALRAAWLEHQVIGMPDQSLTLEQLEQLAPAFGDYGDDPFIAPLPGHRTGLARSAGYIRPGLPAALRRRVR